MTQIIQLNSVSCQIIRRFFLHLLLLNILSCLCLCVGASTDVAGHHDGEQGLVVRVEGDVEGGGLNHDEDGVAD